MLPFELDGVGAAPPAPRRRRSPVVYTALGVCAALGCLGLLASGMRRPVAEAEAEELGSKEAEAESCGRGKWISICDTHLDDYDCQCGGKSMGWDSNPDNEGKCCRPGTTCVMDSEWWGRCIEDDPRQPFCHPSDPESSKNKPGAQCDGDKWFDYEYRGVESSGVPVRVEVKRSTCCTFGYECHRVPQKADAQYGTCQRSPPRPPSTKVQGWHPCGAGLGECGADFVCAARLPAKDRAPGEDLKLCLPQCVTTLWEQCGGDEWEKTAAQHQICCQEPHAECVKYDSDLSKCEWACEEGQVRNLDTGACCERGDRRCRAASAEIELPAKLPAAWGSPDRAIELPGAEIELPAKFPASWDAATALALESTKACAADWQQCDSAPQCCTAGFTCSEVRNGDTVHPEFKQCRPEVCVNAAYEQCDGAYGVWSQDTCCPSGFTCTAKAATYSQCLPAGVTAA